ncbi:MAG TPA: DUF1592 domain-containing protein, partial [Planctomycetia bacterium]|nr:DUF1592 domain-containing protein [Planctomycetia bacterium]
VSDWELASRLSYFLWSSMPDDELRQVAAAGKLRDPAMLQAQTRRMLADPKVRRLAIEFGCQWLEVRDFDRLDEKSDRHFPDFRRLRGAMYEESIRFFVDFFSQNRSLYDLLDGDRAFVNSELARYYGIPVGVPPSGGPDWRLVEGAKQTGRGGILSLASTLAKHSGASRTSPVLRGVWISESLLGERMPKPPPGVPQLPDDEAATAGLTVRQLVEKHASDAKCSVCHKRIDPLGFALEGYDSAGRKRDRDLANRPIDVRTKTAEGVAIDGIDGLRNYLLGPKREAFTRQFCKKLLGYALGRSVRLSDDPLLAEMQAALSGGDHKIGGAVAAIVASRQFREIRGRENAND